MQEVISCVRGKLRVISAMLEGSLNNLEEAFGSHLVQLWTLSRNDSEVRSGAQRLAQLKLVNLQQPELLSIH